MRPVLGEDLQAQDEGMTYPVAFTGSRDFLEAHPIKRAMERLVALHGDALFVHVGDARGADAIVRRFCSSMGVSFEKHDAHWSELGKRAGHERNGRVIAEALELFAFFAPGPPSPGTADCVGQAIDRGIPIRIWFANSRTWKTVGSRCQNPDCILHRYKHGHDGHGTWVVQENGNPMYAPRSMSGEVEL